MQEYTTQQILKGISDNNSVVIQHVYDRYFNEIKKFIEKHGGSYDDAMDIFQDSIIVIYEQMQSGKASKIKTFRSYFYSVCKFRWFNTIRDGRFGEFTNVELEEILPEFEFNVLSPDLGEVMEKERRVRIYFRSFMELDSVCQKMIRYVAYGWAIEDIAREMNFSVIYTYRKRQQCLDKLMKKVEEKLKSIQKL